MGHHDLQQAGLAPALRFPRTDGSRVPYEAFSSQAVYEREQERIYRGPTWNFVALEAEIPERGDFKSTYVGDTPVVVTRTPEGQLAAWVNRCTHRGAKLCVTPRGNASSHACLYHQWNFDSHGNLTGIPFRRGQKHMVGMPPDFDMQAHGLRKLRVESYRGLVFATFSETVAPLPDYLGNEMRPWIDRILCKPIEYLGCTRQYVGANWKLYFENVKDPYHASLLHLFHTTFNILRVGMKARSLPDATHGLHSIITATRIEEDTSGAEYKKQDIRSMNDGFHLEDESVLGYFHEFEEATTNHIQSIFPQLVLQQIHNSLVARQLLPKAPDRFELVFHFFGYADDTPELRALRIKQANLVGPAGYISMEDGYATELVQQATLREGDSTSVLDMGISQPDQQDTLITEGLIRRFWSGYQQLMGF